jgi:hypothetical protein
MLRHVALVRTDVSEELSVSFIRLTRIGELGTTLAAASVVPSSPILVTLKKEALSSSETPVHTRETRCNIPEDAILHSHLCDNLKSCTISTISIHPFTRTSTLNSVFLDKHMDYFTFLFFPDIFFVCTAR